MMKVNGVEVSPNTGILLHFIGLDSCNKRIYHRHGNAYYRPYRNYFCGSETELFLDLEKRELLTRNNEQNRSGTYFWYLTRKGLDYLGEKIECVIHDETD